MSETTKPAAPRRFTSSASKSKPKTAVKAKPAPPSAFNTAPEVSPKKNKFHSFLSSYKVSFIKLNKIKLSLIGLAMVALGASSVAAYSYHLYQQSQSQIKTLQNTKETAKLETKKTIDAVAKLIVLPSDETPTIATVTDSKKLRTQQFFAKATNGDKLLIYSKSKKAILFNPTKNIVVEVAPINLGNNAKPEVAGTAIAAPSPSVAVQRVIKTTNAPLQPSTAPQQ